MADVLITLLGTKGQLDIDGLVFQPDKNKNYAVPVELARKLLDSGKASLTVVLDSVDNNNVQATADEIVPTGVVEDIEPGRVVFDRENNRLMFWDPSAGVFVEIARKAPDAYSASTATELADETLEQNAAAFFAALVPGTIAFLYDDGTGNRTPVFRNQSNSGWVYADGSEVNTSGE